MAACRSRAPPAASSSGATRKTFATARYGFSRPFRSASASSIRPAFRSIRTWKWRWPGSTLSRWASSRLVSCQSDSSSPPSISSTRTRSGCPSAFSCSGLSMTSVSCIVPPWAVLHIETAVSSADGGCGSAIDDYSRLARLGADEARRRVAARLLDERTPHGVRLRLAADDEEDLPRRPQRRQRHGHAIDPRLEARLRSDHLPVGHVERRLARKERGDVAVRADAEQEQVELRRAELDLVRARRRVRAALALDPVDAARRPLDPVEEGTLRHPVVRVRVLRRYAPLVAPPQVDAAPVRGELGRALVRPLGRLAAGEDDVAPVGSRARQALGDGLRDGVGVGEDPELDVAHCSPAASSFERSIAAWIALNSAARTPALSSSCTARIVVPPGEVTASRSSTGCIRSSRSSRAVPSIVCTTSCVEISRDSPSRIPASIIPSASSAKYAGPEPETAVTASIARSATRTTLPRWDSTSSASARCSSPACAPAQTPAMPSWTSEGAFGIARTTGTPGARRASICAVVIAAATERTVCSVVSSPPISPSRTSKSCGLTATTTRPAPATASALESVDRTP